MTRPCHSFFQMEILQVLSKGAGMCLQIQVSKKLLPNMNVSHLSKNKTGFMVFVDMLR